MTIERRYSGGFRVVKQDRHGNVTEEVDTVFFTDYATDEARRSLINHDGYDEDIVVIPPKEGIIPLTVRELEEVCEDNDVTISEGRMGYRWEGENEASNMCGGDGFNTKEDAMRDAVEWLELDTNE